MPSLTELEAAAATVHAVFPPTPQISWPLLSQRAGAELWVKHENHTPIGAFKVRGGIVYMDDLKRNNGGAKGVLTATRRNHGNSVEKNRAMRALGAELIEHGHDFQAAYEFAQARAPDDGLHMLRSFHPL